MTQPESALSMKIQRALRARGAFCFKVRGGPDMMAGLPDIIVCYRSVFIGLETKMPGKRPTVRQLYVHDRIQRHQGIVEVPHSVREALDVLDGVDAWLDRNEGPYVHLSDDQNNPD